MKRLLLASISVLALSAAANAADLYRAAPVGGGYVPPAYPMWQGFYFGGHFGGVWGQHNIKDRDGLAHYYKDWNPPVVQTAEPYTYDPSHSYSGQSWDNDKSSVLGGGQIGYNFQGGWLGGAVFGIEVDFGGVGINGRSHAPRWGNDTYVKLDNAFYADVTGRLGYAVGPALVYVKGGWAYLDADISINDYRWPWARSSSGELNGWTFGGGVEWMIAPSWSVKAEYRHFEFDNVNTDFSDRLCDKRWRFDHDLEADAVTFGVNWHLTPHHAPAPLK